MLNPLQVAGKAITVGAGLAEGAINVARGALGQSPAEPPRSESVRPDSERRPPKPSITDGALADKVESVLFSDSSVPKGKIDVNAVGRDVYLRGEARTPEMINELERRALSIPEVSQVENLLHLPKTPAPSRADTPERAQKTRRSSAAPARKRKPKKVNAEAKKTVGETPAELAAKGEGRKVAQMGSTKKKGKASGKKKAKAAKGSKSTKAAKPVKAMASDKPNEDSGS